MRLRPKTFPERAKKFEAVAEKGFGYRTVKRSGRDLRIGVGEHRGLVKKQFQEHRMALEEQIAVEKWLRKRKIVPKHYELVRIAVKGMVQEYVERPNVLQLETFFREGTIYLPVEEAQLCRTFVERNPSIGFEELSAAYTEAKEHYRMAGRMITSRTNCLVLGRNKKNGKIRIAVIDV